MATRKSTKERRESRYQDTDTFHYYNANPQGNFCCDCVARAISYATGSTWADTIREMTEYAITKGTVFNDPKLVKSYLKHKGWTKHKEPRDWFNHKMSAREFLHDNRVSMAIANLGSHHIVAIEDSKVIDSWDSSRETIHSYWTPPVIQL